MNITCAGEQLTLSADRALFWPARATLLIADPHFGKDEIFRRAGLPIPEGVVTRDLARISGLLRHYSADRLVVLGDFLHGPRKWSEGFHEEFSTWLNDHRQLRIDVVAGNHDRHGAIGSWSDRLTWHQEPLQEGPFGFTHHPRQQESLYVLSGHTHPVLRLRSPWGDRARVPVFWFGEHHAVLPAFGSFTGGANIDPNAAGRVYAIADSAVIAIER
jgi:uncharacterized protein